MKRDRRNQKGYTLLEYAAGAAILMGILFTGLNAMGSGVQGLLSEIGTWAGQRKSDLSATTTPSTK